MELAFYMNNSKLTDVKVINLNLNEDKTTENISRLLEELREKGFEQIQITIKGSAEDLLKNSGHSIKLFERIKTGQNLPDWVVYDLIESSGKLKDTDFNERLKHE